MNLPILHPVAATTLPHLEDIDIAVVEDKN